MTEKSIYQKYEDATRSYYGADKDPLRIVPVVSKSEVAHALAIQARSGIDAISDDDLEKDVSRAQTREKFSRSIEAPKDAEALKEEALQDRLRKVVVNVEMSHANLAPGDFNEDAEKAGAYEMGLGYVQPSPNQEPPKLT